MRKKVVWFVVIGVAALIVFQLTKVTLFNFTHSSMGTGGQEMQRIVIMNGGFGHMHEFSRHMMGAQHRFGPGYHSQIGQFLPIMLQVGLVIIGLVLLKLAAKTSIVNGIGAALVFFGLWLLLPNWLVLLGLVGFGYYWLKTRMSEHIQTDTIGDYRTVPRNKLDFLDEWERTVLKEEK